LSETAQHVRELSQQANLAAGKRLQDDLDDNEMRDSRAKRMLVHLAEQIVKRQADGDGDGGR